MNRSADKDSLRKKLKQVRALAARGNTKYLTAGIQAQLRKLQAYHGARRIGVYVNFGHEFPTKFLFDENSKRNKISVIPLITSFRKKSMRFVHTNQKMIKNRLGIYEPTTRRFVNTHSVDIIFMPLLGFDPQGSRIGMGGGYYDRHLAFKRQRRFIKKPYLVGLAYEAQKLDMIECEPWDISLDAVVTEEKTYLINSALR